MFDNLVESTSNKADLSRKGSFFAGTLAVYGVLIAAIVIGSILWYDASLSADNLELLTELDTPIQTLAPEPEPEQAPEPKQAAPTTTTREVAVRTDAVYDTSTPVPPKEISTAATNIKSVPKNLNFVIGRENSDPAATGGPVGPSVPGGGGPPPGPPSPVVNNPLPPPPPPAPKPTPTPAPKVVRRSGGVLNGAAISRVTPTYPANAKAVRQTGTVVVQVTIDPDGRVVSATAVSGPPLLRAAAAQAARGWRFSPTRLSGQPVEVTGTINFNFTL